MGTDVTKYRSILVCHTQGVNEYKDCTMKGDENTLTISYEHRRQHYVTTYNKGHVVCVEACVDMSRWEQ